MKYLEFKIGLLVVLSFTLVASFALAKGAKEENWPQIFATEIAKSKGNLGVQCLYKSEAAYKAAVKMQKSDEDLKISNEELVSQLVKAGIHIDSYNYKLKKDPKYDCYMTQNELLALRMYTGSYYNQINSALRQLNLQQLQTYRVVIKFLIAALNKLEDYKGVTKRGTNINKQMITSCEPGAAFSDRGLLSTSVGAGFPGGYRFILASDSCKYVAPFSMYPDEEEVLCLPGTIFQIRYMKETPAGTEVILQEAGQRFDIDDLIETLENNPKLQNPAADSYWAQSCQPEHVIFDKESKEIERD